MAKKRCKCCLCQNRPHGPEPKARSRYWDRKPGWVKDDLRKMQKRQTLHEFMSARCSHHQNYGVCYGWNRKAWSDHSKWAKEAGREKDYLK